MGKKRIEMESVEQKMHYNKDKTRWVVELKFEPPTSQLVITAPADSTVAVEPGIIRVNPGRSDRRGP